jgi:hypothetical protein
MRGSLTESATPHPPFGHPLPQGARGRRSLGRAVVPPRVVPSAQRKLQPPPWLPPSLPSRGRERQIALPLCPLPLEGRARVGVTARTNRPVLAWCDPRTTRAWHGGWIARTNRAMTVSTGARFIRAIQSFRARCPPPPLTAAFPPHKGEGALEALSLEHSHDRRVSLPLVGRDQGWGCAALAERLVGSRDEPAP